MCVVIPFILDVRLVDVIPAWATQEEGHTGFLHLPSAALALTFLARRIYPFLSLVDREVEFCELIVLYYLLGISFLRGKIPVRVMTRRFELLSQRQKVSRLPTEPPGRPASVCVCFLPIHFGHQVRWTHHHTGFLIHLLSAVQVPYFFSRERLSRSFPSSTLKSNFVY